MDSLQSYTNFCNNPYRHGWESLLLAEQENRCCYCMRRIEQGETSVEHVIPESFTNLVEADEYAFYTQHSPILSDHVELASVFAQYPNLTDQYIDTVQKLPHLVAYANLMAACKGVSGNDEKGCCCNNVRGNKRILPLPLMSDAAQYVEYDEDGRISINFPADKKLASQTISTLQLNLDTLKDVRSLWHLASKTAYTSDDIAGMDINARRELFCLMFQRDDVTTIDERYRKYIAPANETYWKIFLKYDWFLGYYRARA